MKKLLILFLTVSSVVSIAQESVLLRLKYKKGEVYLLKMQQSMNSTMVMNTTNLTMEMSVLDKEEDIYTSETKISKMTMDVMQGGMQMSFDSTQKEEELDEVGKMMKAQVAPILKVVVTSKTNNLGKVLETKIVPNIPNANQFSNQSVTYPEKAVKVGDSWTDDKEMQGMTIATEYKVNKITKTSVLIAVSAKISGMGTGTSTGTLEIDKESGILLKSSVKSTINASGQDLKVNVEMTMTKK